LAPRETGEVVATVDGTPIYAADVGRQMGARGQTAARALDELVGAELLAAAARRRGLVDDPEVIDARKRERVRAFLRREFEPTFKGPEDVPQQEVDEIYAMPAMRDYFDHGEYHRVAYVRVEV